MPNTIIIAEKPNMGRDIADALGDMLGSSVRSDGLCQHVGSYTVIGALGHLFALSAPDEYGEEFNFPWRLDPLPVLPDEFRIEPNLKRENGKILKNDLNQSIRSRISKIKELCKSASHVVHAGDPDREGQLIVDDILRQANFRGKVSRLWLHAQTKEGIQEAWRAMKDNQDYANLGVAAVARRESDWVIGMNATRAFSTLWWQKGHKGLLNIGRVVTPVVGMIVQREHDIKNFVPIDYFTLQASIQIDSHPPFTAVWQKPSDSEGRPEFDASGKLVIDRQYIESIRQRCNGKEATITTANTIPKKDRPPLLFSLVELQKMAARMGYSPDEVLNAAQALYEKHKLTSYPRTECQYAPESEHKKAAAVLQAIQKNFGSSWTLPDGHDIQRKSAAWDDKKLAEHFAIIPLTSSCPVHQLSPMERDVYKLICRQYAAQFYPAYEYLATTLIAQVASENFKATGRTPTVIGWKILFGGMDAAKRKSATASDEEQENLPLVHVGDKGRADPVTIQSKKTQPPSRFTSITLLEAMEKAYLFVTDPKVKAKLKQVEGIGTAATRASIIARAVTTTLINEDRSGKIINYSPTAKGQAYIQCLPETLSKPDLTAWFEGKLESLSKGELQYDEYKKMLAKLAHHVIATAKDGSALQKIPDPASMPVVESSKKSKSRKKASSGTSKSTRKKATYAS